MCAYILEHVKSINFPFGTNGKLMVLGVPILKPFMVIGFLSWASAKTQTHSGERPNV